MPDPFSLTIITALIVKSASSWLEALRGTLLDKAKDIAVDKGKEAFEKKGGDYLRSALHLDQKDQLKHLQAALEKAIAGGLLAFQSRVERDQYRDILKILFESGPHSDALRREAMRLFTLWDTPNFDELNEIYNRSIRFLTLSQPSPPAEVNAAPYLISFFQALIEALYADSYFKQQMKDVLQTRAGLRTAANTTSIAADTHMLVTYASSMDSVMKQMFSLFQQNLERGMDRAPQLSNSHEANKTIDVAFQIEENTIPSSGTNAEASMHLPEEELVTRFDQPLETNALEEDTYTTAQFESDIQKYLAFVEELLRYHKLIGIIRYENGHDPKLQDVFVPPLITFQDETSRETKHDSIVNVLTTAALPHHSY